MVKPIFAEDEFYHVFNRGVDKRSIFKDQRDVSRFLQSMDEFNDLEPIGSLYIKSFEDNKPKKNPLVEIICYCLNPNHYHLLLKELQSGGISEFMKRLNGGYTWYFNHRHKRSGSLFQGTYKAKHINDNNYLLHLSVYINLNNRAHQLSGLTAKLVRSSWQEYFTNQKYGLCSKSVILEQFKHTRDYIKFAEEELKDIVEKKKEDRTLDELLIE